MVFFFLFYTFLPSSGEHIFWSIAAFFALDDVIHLSYFPSLIPPKLQIFGPFSDWKITTENA